MYFSLQYHCTSTALDHYNAGHWFTLHQYVLILPSVSVCSHDSHSSGPCLKAAALPPPIKPHKLQQGHIYGKADENVLKVLSFSVTLKKIIGMH